MSTFDQGISELLDSKVERYFENFATLFMTHFNISRKVRSRSSAEKQGFRAR